ncbi:MAG: hypothetical protein ACR2MY_13535 [Candidatus Dormibacteria bacterium]
MLLIVVRVLSFFLGVYMVTSTLLSTLQTFVLPRAANTRLARFAFTITRRVLDTFVPPHRPYLERDRSLALLAPIGLLVLPAIWLLLVFWGFTLMFWGMGITPFGEAVLVSGSQLFTLGFERPDPHNFFVAILFGFVESAIGLGLLALLISYLPTIYAAFSRRETLVTMLEPLAGSPPSALTMIKRMHRVGALDRLDGYWRRYQEWFADIEESHTSLAPLVFLRSPQPNQSWVVTAGCILDAAALTASCLDLARSADAEVCLRAGFIMLRRVADFFSISYDANPRPDDPVSVSRAEFDEVYDSLQEAGLPMKPDRDACRRAFNGWRVNYDTVLLHLAGLTAAPPGRWSGDRPIPPSSVPLRAFFRRVTVAPPATVDRDE